MNTQSSELRMPCSILLHHATCKKSTWFRCEMRNCVMSGTDINARGVSGIQRVVSGELPVRGSAAHTTRALVTRVEIDETRRSPS